MSEKRAIAIGDEVKIIDTYVDTEYVGVIDTLFYNEEGLLMARGWARAYGQWFVFSFGLKPDKYEIAE